MAKKSLSSAQEHQLVQAPHDPFLDGPITRREVDQAFIMLSQQDDTTNLMVNFLLEKIGVSRQEMEAWVKAKADEINRQRALLARMQQLGLLKMVDGKLVGATREEVAKFREEHPEEFKQIYVDSKRKPAPNASDPFKDVEEQESAEPSDITIPSI
jgi:hypothetical protein